MMWVGYDHFLVPMCSRLMENTLEFRRLHGRLVIGRRSIVSTVERQERLNKILLERSGLNICGNRGAILVL